MIFVVFWMDELLIYSQTTEEHLKHIQLVFEEKGIFPMKQKVKAITDLAPTISITAAGHVIGLIGYYRKFFPKLSDMIWLLNKLTRKKVPFKWSEQCQKSLDYVKQIFTTSSILAYPDSDKQYYIFTDNSKHSWREILIQYTKQTKEDSTKLNIHTPLHTKEELFKVPRKN